jgi:hypothetical protein
LLFLLALQPAVRSQHNSGYKHKVQQRMQLWACAAAAVAAQLLLQGQLLASREVAVAMQAAVADIALELCTQSAHNPRPSHLQRWGIS